MFINVLMLTGVGAAVIPLVLHLLSRARYRDVEWGAMMFLSGADARQRQSSRMNRWLLMLMRMATVALLAVALARPVLYEEGEGVAAAVAGAAPAGTGAAAASPGAAAADGRVTAVILLDCSASMAFDENGHSRLDLARGAARQVLEGLRPGDRVAILPMGLGPGGGGDLYDDFYEDEQALRPSSDRRAVAERLEALQPGHGQADVADGLNRALDLLRRDDDPDQAPTGPRPPGASGHDIYVIGDRQALSWQNVDEAFLQDWQRRLQQAGPTDGSEAAAPAPPPTRLFAIPVGGREVDNVVVESVALVDEPAVVGQPAEVEVRLRNRGPVQRAALPLRITAAGQALPEQTVNLAPDSAAAVRAPVRFDAEGSQVIAAEVTSAGLVADDALQSVVEVIEPVRVLVLSGDERPESFRSESDFLKVALAPYAAQGEAGMDSTIISVLPAEKWMQSRSPGAAPPAPSPSSNLNDYQVVILANVERLDEAQARALERFVYNGGGLLVAPGNLSRVEAYNKLLYRGGAGVLPAELLPATAADGSQATTLLGFDPDHPIFRFMKGQPDKLPPATIGRYFPAEPKVPEARVLSQFASGRPFMVESQSGRGRVLLMTVPVDADWTTLPLSRFYLPFMQSVVRYLAGGAVRDRNLLPGEPLRAAFDAAPVASGRALPRVLLERPDGGELVPLTAVRVGGQAEVRYTDTWAPGLYRLRVRPGESGEDVWHFVVNAPLEESDLTQLTDRQWRWLEEGLDLRQIDAERQPVAAVVTRSREGRELWAWALGAVLVLAIAELAVARACSRDGA